MVAVTVFAGSMGMMLGLLVKSVELRRDAGRLTRAVFLARQQLEEIKTLKTLEETEGEFQAFPEYRYRAVIQEKEIDLSSMAEELGVEIDTSDDPLGSEVTSFLEERGLMQDMAGGAVFNMLHYQVTVFYGDNDSYTLDYYRGLGVTAGE